MIRMGSRRRHRHRKKMHEANAPGRAVIAISLIAFISIIWLAYSIYMPLSRGRPAHVPLMFVSLAIGALGLALLFNILWWRGRRK